MEGITDAPNPADRRVRLVTVQGLPNSDAAFQTFFADQTVAGAGTLGIAGARSDGTLGLHQNTQPSFPIGERVDSLGRVLRVSRVVLSGTITNHFGTVDPPDREISKIEIVRLLSDGQIDGTFPPVDVSMDGESQCRSEGMGFASDAVSGRFFVSCVKKSPAVARAAEKAILVLGFDSSGTPLQGFGAAGVTLSESGIPDPESSPLSNLVGGLALPLVVIPSCSPLLGGDCTGPGVAVGRTYQDATSARWPYVTVLNPLGSPVSTFGTMAAPGTVRPGLASTRLSSLAYIPRLGEDPAQTGLYVGLGNSQIILLKAMGSAADVISIPEAVTSPDTWSLAVDPANGNAVTTHAGESGGRVGFLNGTTKTVQLLTLAAQVPSFPPGGNWIEWLGFAHYHESGAFFVAQTLFELGLAESGNFQQGFMTRLLRIDRTGQLTHASVLPMDTSPFRFPFGLSAGPSGELQLSLYSADAAASFVHQTARVVGVPGLKP